MRLINTELYYLKNFQANDVPPYAILSHRWENGEVSFKDYRPSEFMFPSNREKGSGYQKIKIFCSLARKLGLEWAWVDTCCIDQSSSAELSETINSMFDWYRWSELCCVYMSDVRGSDRDAFQKSKWFLRGWTLQELLAPVRHTYFYDCDWTYLGTRRDLALYISAASNIPAAVIYNQSLYPIKNYSVAQRMSWASKRKTTRPEDIAYCLLGLFSINMPLLYGEGSTAAYARLQLEIIRTSDDESIYAWSTPSEIDPRFRFGQVPSKQVKFGEIMYRILARHPSKFQAESKTIQGGWQLPPRSFETTNRGIKLRTRLYKKSKWLSRSSSISWDAYDPKLRILPLRCEREGEPLALVLMQHSKQPDLFFRTGLATLRKNVPRIDCATQKVFLILNEAYVEGEYNRMRLQGEVLMDLRAELREEISRNFRATVANHLPDLSMMDFDYFFLNNQDEIKAVFRSSNTLRDSDLDYTKRDLEHVHADSVVLTIDEFQSRLLRADISASWVTEFLAKLKEKI